MTGASVRFNAWSAVWSDTWERSIKMPSRFISGMSSLPRGLSPPQRSLTSPKIPAESANALLQLCVRVMYLTPSWWYILNTASCIDDYYQIKGKDVDLPPREFPSMCAPSSPKRLAILPCFIAHSTWSAVRARANVSLYLEMRLFDTSSCSRASGGKGVLAIGGGFETWTCLGLQK